MIEVFLCIIFPRWRAVRCLAIRASILSTMAESTSSNMSDTFFAEMREKLLVLRTELESVAETGDDASDIVELDQARVGRLSRMDAMQAQAMSQASERRREVMLRSIAAALERIDSDDYGYCRNCEEMIDRRRLEFDPTVVLCIDCATKAEQQ